MIFKRTNIIIFLLGVILLNPLYSYALAENTNQNNFSISNETPKAQIYLSPQSGSFLVGSIFEVGVYLDTKGSSINTVNLDVNFDSKKLAVSKPSGGKSFFGELVSAPTYNNTSGLLSMDGVVHGGIVTSSGLITTISFKVLAAGDTSITIGKNTSAYVNDGLGTKANLSLGRADFNLRKVASAGVNVYSDTHPSSDNWYNNNNPIFAWENFKDSLGYSILLDTNPNTNPENIITTNKTTYSYTNVQDGIWYFHIKSKEGDGWGNTSHYKIKIDTKAPLKFKPVINKIAGASKDEYMLIFSTNDQLSGVDHYEVGILSNNRDQNSLPVFIQAESPYIVPNVGKDNIKVIVKAFDGAGNTIEADTSLYPSYVNIIYIISLIIIIILLIIHYVFGHHIGRNIIKAYTYFKNISKREK